MARQQARARGLSPVALLLVLLGLCASTAAAAFQCAPKPHIAAAEPGPNNLCQCGPGWFGPTCEVCTTDQACGILLKDPDGICRNTTFTAIRESFGWCEVSSQDVENLIHGTGFVQIYFAANGTFFFDFIKRRGAGDFISLFRCNSKATKVTEDPKLGQVKYASPDLTCNMTCELGSDRTCSQGLANIVKNVGVKGGSTIVCDPKKRTCDVHENVLDTFLGGVQTSGCYMSECALRSETVTVATGSFANIAKQPPAQQTAYVLGMLLLASTLALMAVAGSYYARSGKFASYASTAALLGLAPGNDAGAHHLAKAASGLAGADAAAAAKEVGVGSPALASEEAGTALPGSSSSSNGDGASAAAAAAAAAVASAAALAAAAASGGGAAAGAGDAAGRPATYNVAWDGLTYAVGKREILKGVSGYALPGELLAVMGPSGSGKTTLIDVLAMKPKRGVLGGELYYAGKKRGEDAGADEAAREAIGFVDQEDNLMGTLTVFESVLFSAFLRLPDGMPMADKAARVMQVLKDLRIAHVADSFIGIKGRRGISGGEKRRVVVAMELVKVPQVLFLDEPTSGLDSYNAALLVDCLRDLAFRHRTNVVMTIHQPRSNVFTGFDRNLVLNQGEVTYFGTTKEVAHYFASIGHAIPRDYNPADFLIDVLFLECAATGSPIESHHHLQAGPASAPEGEEAKDPASGSGAQQEVEMVPYGRQPSRATFQQRLAGASSKGSGSGSGAALSPPRAVRVSIEEEAPLDLSTSGSHGAGKEAVPVLPSASPRSHQAAGGSSSKGLGGDPGAVGPAGAPEANPFAQAFARSARARLFKEELAVLIKPAPATADREHMLSPGTEAGSTNSSTSSAAASTAAGGPKASLTARAAARARRWCWEVGVLSRRSLLDLVRNPVLFLSHLGATTYFAVVLGTVYYDLSMQSLQAIQNRLGAFLLSCVFLCFTSVSALPLFWLEKNLYLHEQSNRFYTASAYFVCKIFFDLIPLRVLPTVIYGAITYGMIGLRPGFQHFVLYEAFLVLLVTTSAVIALVIGMLTRHIMSGILIATIVMIHFLMLTNLFINFDSMNIKGLRFLKRVSFFNYAYEGMAENELVGRRLEKFAISTGTGVLHELGFSTTAMYFDLMSLLVYLMVAVAIAFVVLKVAVREMR